MTKIIILILIISNMNAIELKKYEKELNALSEDERRVIVHKGTEIPFSGKYNYEKSEGVYVCKVCKSALFNSSDKFNSGSGWPSFDDEIKGSIKRVLDKDKKRVEIVCAKCGAHLGHVFEGEGFSNKNTRHCVNSISLDFIKKESSTKDNIKKAYFAGGCFWGVEYYMQQIKGVIEVTSGFMGGWLKNPTYNDVVYTNTGHLETVEVIYNGSITSYELLAKTFFEIHDPTQTNGQGPDIAEQYLSAVFTNDENEKKTIQTLIEKLTKNGYKVATKILDKDDFYKADEYHQNYYLRKGTKPYCHAYVKRF